VLSFLAHIESFTIISQLEFTLIADVQMFHRLAMVIVHSKRHIIGLVIASTAVSSLLFVYYTAKFNHLAGTTKTEAENGEDVFADWPPISTVTAANVVFPASFDYRNETFNCTTVVLDDIEFPVCHYTAEADDTVSGLLLRGIYFEEDEVKRFLRLLRLDRQLQMVDIGANVGLYSLPAARLTKVLAVEPNWHSMARLAKAVDLGESSSNITLVHNAVSDVRATFNMGVHPSNQGNAFLIRTRKCKGTPTNKPCYTLSPIRAIFLNDLLPLMRSKSALMKIDVEGHEAIIFTDSSAGQFFDQIDVPLVLMEWNLCKRHPAYLVQRLLDFFYSRNYAVFDMENSKLQGHYLVWPENVLFKKLTYLRF